MSSVGARLIATRPEDGETAAAGAAVVAVLELDGGDAEALGVRMRLDGEDVTDRCAIRGDRAWPPRRAEVVLADVGAGAHRAEVWWPGAAPHSWWFELGAA